MSRDDPRGMPRMSEEDALDAALADAMPMIVFWHEAKKVLGEKVMEAVIEACDDDIWDIIRQYSDDEDVRLEIFNEIKNHKIKELTE